MSTPGHVKVLPRGSSPGESAPKRTPWLGGTVPCFNALRVGDLDCYAEYTGTGLVSILKDPMMTDPDEVYQHVKQAFREQYDLVWMKPFGFNNTYTLTMKRTEAERLGFKTISDLAAYVRRRSLGQ